jgi:hypothetical protein
VWETDVNNNSNKTVRGGSGDVQPYEGGSPVRDHWGREELMRRLTHSWQQVVGNMRMVQKENYKFRMAVTH